MDPSNSPTPTPESHTQAESLDSLKQSFSKLLALGPKLEAQLYRDSHRQTTNLPDSTHPSASEPAVQRCPTCATPYAYDHPKPKPKPNPRSAKNILLHLDPVLEAAQRRYKQINSKVSRATSPNINHAVPPLQLEDPTYVQLYDEWVTAVDRLVAYPMHMVVRGEGGSASAAVDSMHMNATDTNAPLALADIIAMHELESIRSGGTQESPAATASSTD